MSWVGPAFSAAGAIANMFGGGGGSSYNDYINTIKKFEPHVMPYMHNGEWASGALRGALGNLLKNGGVDYENNVMSQYQESPWAKYQTGELSNAANKAAAAGGYAGTPQEQEALAGKLQGVVSQDQQKFFNNSFQPYQAGITGATNQSQQGLQANSQYWQYLKDLAQARANQQSAYGASHGLGAILGGLGQAAGDVAPFFGGGGRFGGMFGGMNGMGSDGGITQFGDGMFNQDMMGGL